MRESLTRCRTNVLLEDGTLNHFKILWVNDDNDIMRGTMRGGAWDANGNLVPRGTDRRDSCIRITMDTGWEHFVPWDYLANKYETGNLVAFEW